MKDADINAIRNFNRFYTDVIGLLDQHLLESSFSLPEARVLYEVYHLQPCTATEIMTKMSIDKGYLSRVLKGFGKKGIITRMKGKDDGRTARLKLTAKGNAEFQKLNDASVEQIKGLLNKTSPSDIALLISSLRQCMEILRKATYPDEANA